LAYAKKKKAEDHIQKITKAKNKRGRVGEDGVMAELRELLPRQCEALSSNPSTFRKKQSIPMIYYFK
jgi:hypothetical protein